MALNSRHIRAGAIGAGIIVVAAFLLFGGPFSSPCVVSIDFGMYPGDFEGCEVEINGKVVGKLERYGQATRTGFRLRKGEHEVRILHPEFDSELIPVTVAKSGDQARLLLDLIQTYDRETETSKMVITTY